MRRLGEGMAFFMRSFWGRIGKEMELANTNDNDIDEIAAEIIMTLIQYDATFRQEIATDTRNSRGTGRFHNLMAERVGEAYNIIRSAIKEQPARDESV